jgi:hypothetical protein
LIFYNVGMIYLFQHRNLWFQLPNLPDCFFLSVWTNFDHFHCIYRIGNWVNAPVNFTIRAFAYQLLANVLRQLLWAKHIRLPLFCYRLSSTTHLYAIILLIIIYKLNITI